MRHPSSADVRRRKTVAAGPLPGAEPLPMQTLYFMSPPGPTWGLRGRANFRSREALPADASGARAEWLALARAIEARGGTVVALPSPDPDLTGLPYAAE